MFTVLRIRSATFRLLTSKKTFVRPTCLLLSATFQKQHHTCERKDGWPQRMRSLLFLYLISWYNALQPAREWFAAAGLLTIDALAITHAVSSSNYSYLPWIIGFTTVALVVVLVLIKEVCFGTTISIEANNRLFETTKLVFAKSYIKKGEAFFPDQFPIVNVYAILLHHHNCKLILLNFTNYSNLLNIWKHFFCKTQAHHQKQLGLFDSGRGMLGLDGTDNSRTWAIIKVMLE